VTGKHHLQAAGELRDLMATYAQHEDLINIGAYVKGSNPKLDQAISVMERIKVFLKQGMHERASIHEALAQMNGILKSVKG
jgi:flagellum-specific ATP synthase